MNPNKIHRPTKPDRYGYEFYFLIPGGREYEYDFQKRVLVKVRFNPLCTRHITIPICHPEMKLEWGCLWRWRIFCLRVKLILLEKHQKIEGGLYIPTV